MALKKLARACALAFTQLLQVAVQASVVFGDGHLVVVDHDDEVRVQFSCVVQSSKASPPLSEPSPMTAMTLPFSPFRSRPLASPPARLTEVEVWPMTKWSCALSDGSE